MRTIAILFVLIANTTFSFAQISGEIRFNSDDFVLRDTIGIDNEMYSYFSSNPFETVTMPGFPLLPIRYEQFILPVGMLIDSITITFSNQDTIQLNALIFPAQHPVASCLECAKPNFKNIDSSIYFSNKPFPMASAIPQNYGYWHTSNIATVVFYPYCYYPATNNIVFSGTFNYTIYYSLPNNASSRIQSVKMNIAKYGRFISQLESTIENPEDIETFLTGIEVLSESQREDSDTAEFVVIAPESFLESQSMNDFIEWKRKRGIDLRVYSMEEIDAYAISQNWVDDICNNVNTYTISDSAARLRKYLEEYYLKGGAEWILLVGDENLIPVRKFWATHGPNYADLNVITDKYYADFNSDYEADGDGLYGEYGTSADTQDWVDLYPEAYIGRITCTNVQEFSNWVTKLINYETKPGNGDTSYLQRFTMNMADEFQQNIESNQFIYNNLSIFSTSIYKELPTYDASLTVAPRGDTIIAGLNRNPGGWWTWSNHGSPTYFASMTYGINEGDKSHVSTGSAPNGLLALSNVNKYGIILSGCCSVASFGEATNCMAEEVLTAPLKGSVAISACTDLSWINDENARLKKYSTLIRNSHDGSITTIGHTGVLEWDVNSMVGGIQNYETYLTHNYFGDPEMMYYTKVPTRIVASVSPKHIDATQTTTVSIELENLATNDTIIVCLYKQAIGAQVEFQRVKMLKGVHGHDTVSFVIPANTLADNLLYVTISGFNYLPYTEEIIVSPGCTYYPNATEYISGAPFPWTGTRFKNHDVVIDSLATLTILGEVYFVPEARLIVKSGGKLILNGGKLSTSCEALWKGVEVWGHSNLTQYSNTNQGFIQVTNNGSINDAICAISTAKLGTNGRYIQGTTGGVFSCTQAKFTNNRCSIHVYPYQYQNYNYNSTISNSDFILDEFFIEDTTSNAMVYYEGIKGISNSGLSFKSKLPETVSAQKRGIGILAINAGFGLNHICSQTGNPIPCTDFRRPLFEGLSYGIKCTSTGAPKSILIGNCDFKNNNRGIYLSAVVNPSITHCYFKTKTGTTFLPSSGLYLDHCTGYTIQENSFEGCNQGGTTYDYGIVVNSSGTAANEIYNNLFSSLQYGIAAQDTNRNPVNGVGLVCKCNDFSSNKTDQAVLLSSSSNTYKGISLYQGDGLSMSGPAGNTFSLRTSGTGDLYNDGVKFNYYHHRDIGQFRLKPEFYFNVDRTEYLANDYTKQTACPSKLGGGGGVNQEQIKDKLASTFLLIQQKQDSLVALIDGGNTKETTEDVVYSSPPEALDLRDGLLEKSPYLSDTVMQSAIANEFVLPNAMVRDILVANPQAAASDPVMDELDKRIDPMPDEMYNQILAGEFIVSPKESKEAEIASLNLEREINYNTLVSYYLADTIGVLSDSLDQLLISENRPEARYMLAYKQLFEGDTVAAVNTLAAITATFDLTTAEMTRHENYLSYFAVVGSMDADTLPGYECDSLQLAALNLLSQEGCEPVSSYARNLLIANGTVTYNEPYLVADELKSSRVKRECRNITTPTVPLLTLNPNPCSYFVIAVYSLENNSTADAFLTISTLQNVEIKTIQLIGANDQVVIALNNFSPGVYVASLKAGGKLIDSKKIIVVK